MAVLDANDVVHVKKRELKIVDNLCAEMKG